MKHICTIWLFSLLALISCSETPQNVVLPTATIAEETISQATQATATQFAVTNTSATTATMLTGNEPAANEPTEPPPTLVPTPANEASAVLAPLDVTERLPVGDPKRGEALNISKACSGCHLIDAIGAGPSWIAEKYAGNKGIAQRAEERWQQAGYTGSATNATEYLVESILMPNAYVIDGYSHGIMPGTYGELLTDQDLADIIAFLVGIR